MEITEVRVKLMEDPDDRLRAFCSITFDNCFVVRDLKIIEGSTGPFVAMPSRKLTFHCPKCGAKNHLRANFCNQCGARLREYQVRDQEGRVKLYADIAHPINSECREMIQNRVIEEFQAELERSGQPGYVSRYDEEYDAGDYDPGDYDQESQPRDRAAPGEERTIRTDAAAPPQPPHTREKPARQPAEQPAPPERATQESEEPPQKSTFGEGVFDEEQGS